LTSLMATDLTGHIAWELLVDHARDGG